jgi:DNA-binding transcriptional LysR family regulator
MDWRGVKFDWNRARAFLVTAEEGSLSAASRALNIAQPTLGRQIKALEVELGVALFERSGRGLEITPSGKELLEHARDMGDAANKLSLISSSKSESLEGNIAITATEMMAVFILPPLIQKLRKLEPGISIELISSNQASDLMRREADIAIRNFRPSQPDLIAKKIKNLNYNLYATPEYLASIGNPKTAKAFSQAEFIGFNRASHLIEILNDKGFTISDRNFSVKSESSFSNWALVKQGLGLGGMQEDIGDADPFVERALPNFSLPQTELWLVAHRELKVNKRIRMAFDFLASELSY